MMKALIVTASLLLVRGAIGTSCKLDATLRLPDEFDPGATSFCHDLFNTVPATSKAIPSPLTELFHSGHDLTSFCSCILGYSTTTAAATSTSWQHEASTTHSTTYTSSNSKTTTRSGPTSTSSHSQTSSTQSISSSKATTTSTHSQSKTTSSIASSHSQVTSSHSTSTAGASSTQSNSCPAASTVTLSITPSHCIASLLSAPTKSLIQTDTITVSETASTVIRTTTLTVSQSQSHCSAVSTAASVSHSTQTNTITVSKATTTVTLTATLTVSGSQSHCSGTASTIPTSSKSSTATVTVSGIASRVTDTVTLTVSRTQSTCASPSVVTTGMGTSRTNTMVVSQTASTVTVTLSANASVSTVTASASTVTVSSNITLSASTVTITASGNHSLACSTGSSTTTSRPQTTGTPVCTQPPNPQGTCAYPADYNSGTTPQIWAGPADSLDACAILCAGEPGCLSFAYDQTGALPCVLFNSRASGLTLTSNPSSVTIFYDSTCFACSGAAPRPISDNGCTPSLQPPAGSNCGLNALFGGIPMFAISTQAAASLGACEQQCLLQATCQSLTYDGTNCMLFSVNALQLELNGVVFPVDPGVAGSQIYYDRGCFVCLSPNCICPPVQAQGKRDLTRREAGVQRREIGIEHREAELERRMNALIDRERLSSN